MSSSIFSKLANAERHKEFIEKLELHESPIDPGKRASTVAGMTSMGLGLKVSCGSCKTAAAIAGETLVSLAGSQTPLNCIVFACRTCGGHAMVIPDGIDRLSALPLPDSLFAFTPRTAGTLIPRRETEAGPETQTSPGHAGVQGKRKRGRPRKDSALNVMAKNQTANEPQSVESPFMGTMRGPKPRTIVAAAPEPKRKRGRPRKTPPAIGAT
mgnify:CR=1 FL=1